MVRRSFAWGSGEPLISHQQSQQIKSVGVQFGKRFRPLNDVYSMKADGSDVKQLTNLGSQKAGVIEDGQKVRFGFHNSRHSLASALVKIGVDPMSVQEFLRQAHITTTLQLYAQSDKESKRDAQGRFLEQLLRDKARLLTERIQ